MKNYTIISQVDPQNTISEQYRKLSTSIDYSSIDEPLKVINFTSSFPAEGKTITGLNLAVVYGQRNLKTLIIDLDLRKPKIHRAFGLSNTEGLTEFITSDKKVEEFIVKASENIDVLVSGNKVPFPSEIVTSDKLKDMIKDLKGKYDRIIIDCPPLTAVADSTIISNLCDGTIFVVASRKTNKDIAKEVLKQLKDTGANVIGGFMTHVSKNELFYGADYYYNYDD